MITVARLRKEVSRVLIPGGFVFDRGMWWHNSDEVLVCFALNPNALFQMIWSDVVVWIRHLDDASTLKPQHSHIQWRLEELFPKHLTLIRTALNYTMSTDELISEYLVMLQDQFVPFVKSQLTSVSELRELYRNERMRSAAVVISAAQLLTQD
jgi:hypothetical protein